MTVALLELLLNIIWLLNIVIFAWVVVSWLLVFNVINTRNQFVYQIVRGLDAIVDPLVAPIRKILPAMGGMDFSPIVLIFGLMFLSRLIQQILIDNPI